MSEKLENMELGGPRVCVVGVNHNTTPIEIWERLSIPRDRMQEALASLRNFVPQGVIVATCNRTEVYTLEGDERPTEQAIRQFLAEWAGLADEELSLYLHCSFDLPAMRHLTETASGLCSMIVGEWEVLGQVRQALADAEQAGMVDLPLRNLFQHAIRTGRRVREHTEISRNALSVSSMAVELATKVVGDIHKSRVLLIGAGEAGKLVAKAFSQRGVERVSVASRSLKSAQDLATTLGGNAINIEEMWAEMETADIVISCTGAPHFVVRREMVAGVMDARLGRPLVIIDIAVPRDVELEADLIDGVSLYDIDDFTHLSRRNRKAREREIARASKVVDEEMERFAAWWQALEARPAISALTCMAEDIRQRQLAMTLKRLPPLSTEQEDSLEAMTKSIVNKILHNPIQCLKNGGERGEELRRTVEELFDLNGNGSNDDG